LLRFDHVTRLVRAELRGALRERNVLVATVFVPLVLYPAIIWATITGLTYVRGQSEDFVSRVVLDAHGVAASPMLDSIRLSLEGDESIRLVSPSPYEPREALLSGELDLLVIVELPGPEAGKLQGNLLFELVHDASQDRSVRALGRVRALVDEEREAWIERSATELGLPEDARVIAEIEQRNTASEKDIGRFVLSLVLPLVTVLIVAIGTMAPAVDITAGERERSTRETTLTLATARLNVALAKFIAVSSLATMAGLLNLVAMTISMRVVFAALAAERDSSLDVSLPLMAIPMLALGTTLIALLLASLMMILASFARTYREGQSLVMPVYFLSFMPMLFLQQPDARQTLVTACIPLINVFMMFRDAIAGRFDPLLITITIAVLLACVTLCLALAARLLRSETLLLGEGDLSGRALFRRVVRESRGPSR
jgi:ABC-type Na+ efflux pump permease subunit